MVKVADQRRDKLVREGQLDRLMRLGLGALENEPPCPLVPHEVRPNSNVREVALASGTRGQQRNLETVPVDGSVLARVLVNSGIGVRHQLEPELDQPGTVLQSHSLSGAVRCVFQGPDGSTEHGSVGVWGEHRQGAFQS